MTACLSALLRRRNRSTAPVDPMLELTHRLVGATSQMMNDDHRLASLV